MDQLFTPWRYAYVTADRDKKTCLFCDIAARAAADDDRTLVLHRGRHNFVVLNAYPYTSGHLMIVPYRHEARLSMLDDSARNELLSLAARAEAVLEDTYRAQGLNFGFNLGKCAGAGVAGHLHMHAVPRWFGDTSFMTVTGETRILPESLEESWTRLRGRFGGGDS